MCYYAYYFSTIDDSATMAVKSEAISTKRRPVEISGRPNIMVKDWQTADSNRESGLGIDSAN